MSRRYFVMLNKNIQTFIGCDSDYTNSRQVIFGAPFDGTTSFRPGTRFGPAAVRNESFGIETYSPYQDRDLSEIKVFDSGDLELPFGNTPAVLDLIYKRTKVILSDGKMPVMIGGEHLVTLGAFRAVYEKYPDAAVIQLDAHADLRDDYLGEKLSHACVIRRIWELAGDNRIFQAGIRSGEKSEFEFAQAHTRMQKFDLSGFSDIAASAAGRPVYFTLDLDVLDPSVFSGTGTPEAGGVGFSELINAVLKLKLLNIVGFDITELSPVYDASGVSTAAACKILRELLLTTGGK